LMHRVRQACHHTLSSTVAHGCACCSSMRAHTHACVYTFMFVCACVCTHGVCVCVLRCSVWGAQKRQLVEIARSFTKCDADGSGDMDMEEVTSPPTCPKPLVHCAGTELRKGWQCGGSSTFPLFCVPRCCSATTSLPLTAFVDDRFHGNLLTCRAAPACSGRPQDRA